MMFWYSSKVTLESKVFLRATLILRLGVRAWVTAAISAKAVKRMIMFVVVFVVMRLLILCSSLRVY